MARNDLERTGLRKLRALAKHDLQRLLSEDPPDELLPDGCTWHAYRAEIRQCLDDIQRSRTWGQPPEGVKQ